MKLYTIYFRAPEKEYNPERRVAIKKIPRGADLKLHLNAEGGYTVIETDIKKYWDFAGGIEKLLFIGDLDDALLKPYLAEPDFVDNQIRSKKNGDILGYQG